MKDLGKEIDISLQEILPDLIQLRRHIHAHPELSGQEYHTAALASANKGYLRINILIFFSASSRSPN